MILPSDENMVPGQTYTFTFELNDWILTPSVTTLVNELEANAPAFISFPKVNFGAKPGLFQGAYTTVTFQYSGDGSDVIGDVANEIILAWQGDNFAFVQAEADNVTTVPGAGVGQSNVVGLPTGSVGFPSLNVSGTTTASIGFIALIVLVGAFLLSGGAGIIRGATS